MLSMDCVLHVLCSGKMNFDNLKNISLVSSIKFSVVWEKGGRLPTHGYCILVPSGNS